MLSSSVRRRIIGVYDWLIAQAEALGHEEVVELLRENLQQEQHTLDEVRRATRAMAQQGGARAV
jgi:ferritin-like metal-binding protein YciE